MIKHDALAVMEKILKHSQNEEIRVRAIHCIKALREMQGAVEVSRWARNSAMRHYVNKFFDIGPDIVMVYAWFRSCSSVV